MAKLLLSKELPDIEVSHFLLLMFVWSKNHRRNNMFICIATKSHRRGYVIIIAKRKHFKVNL